MKRRLIAGFALLTCLSTVAYARGDRRNPAQISDSDLADIPEDSAPKAKPAAKKTGEAAALDGIEGPSLREGEKRERDENTESKRRRPGEAPQPRGNFGFFVSAMNPAPSWIGVSAVWQLSSWWMIHGGTGAFWSSQFLNDLRIQSFAVGTRFLFFPWVFSPFVGGGVSFQNFHGQGEFQGLNATTVLGYVSAGIDLSFGAPGFRAALGGQLSFPQRLMVPFLDLGFMF